MLLKSLQSCEHVSKSMFPIGRCGFFHNGKFLGTVHLRCCCPPSATLPATTADMPPSGHLGLELEVAD